MTQRTGKTTGDNPEQRNRPAGAAKRSARPAGRPAGAADPSARPARRPAGAADPSARPARRPAGAADPSARPARPADRPVRSASSAQGSTRRPSSSGAGRGSGRSAPSGRAPQNRGRASSGSRQHRKKRSSVSPKILIAIAAVLLAAAVIAIIIAATTIPEPSHLTIESEATQQTLTWKGKPKRISYRIYRREGGSESEFQEIGTVAEGAEDTFISSELSSATLYEYKVTAVKGSGENEKESKGVTISSYTLPETVTDIKAVTLSKETLTVTWPEIPRSSGYEFRYGLDENLSDAVMETLPADTLEKDAATGACTYTLSGLTVGSVYYISIRAFTDQEIFGIWNVPFPAEVTKAVDMTGVDINGPMVALTFDDGPDNGKVTYRILDALKAVGGRATFFQLGQLCEQNPEVAKRIVDEGHQLGCHTYDHTHMGNTVTRDDIIRGNDAIESTTGVRPLSFRPTGGEYSDLIFSTCTEEGMALFQWDVDTRDWSSRDAFSVMQEIRSSTGDGSIILMHNIYDSTAEAVEEAVPWLVEQGYQLVTVDQLIQAKTGAPPVPGQRYYSATIIR